MAWMPSCELPAMRMTASEMWDISGVPPVCAGVAVVASLILRNRFSRCVVSGDKTTRCLAGGCSLQFAEQRNTGQGGVNYLGWK